MGAGGQGRQHSYRHESGNWHSVGLRCWPQEDQWQRMRVEKQVRARLQRLDCMLRSLSFICGQWEPLEVMKTINHPIRENWGREAVEYKLGRGQTASRPAKRLMWASSLAVGNQKERTQSRVTIWRESSQKEKKKTHQMGSQGRCWDVYSRFPPGQQGGGHWIIHKDRDLGGARGSKKEQFNFALDTSKGQLKIHVCENSEPQEF